MDPCKPNPCPTPTGGQQFQCVANKEDDAKHVCICPVGKKGATCEEGLALTFIIDFMISRFYFKRHKHFTMSMAKNKMVVIHGKWEKVCNKLSTY